MSLLLTAERRQGECAERGGELVDVGTLNSSKSLFCKFSTYQRIQDCVK